MKILLVDEGWVQTLWLAQSLLERGVAVEIASTAGSHYPYRVMGIRAHRLPAGDDLRRQALGRIVSEGDYDQVVPLTERFLLLAASVRACDAKLALPVPRDRLALIESRTRMLEFVASLGFDIPPQERLPDEDGIERAAARLGWPLVIRGSQGEGGAQVRIAADIPAARKAWREIRAISPERPFAQQFVSGHIVVLAGLFRQGRAILASASRPIERWPGATSPSTVQETIQDPGLSAWLKLFEALDYTGLASMELMRRPDGGYTFIELNPRSWAAVAAFRRAGVDYSGLYAAHLTGVELAPAAHPFPLSPGRIWPVFPRYIEARIRRGGVADPILHPRLWWRALLQAPWSRPRLLLALLGNPFGILRRRLGRMRARGV